MVISWYGEGCFKIQAGDLSILIDPINSSSGLQIPRGKFDIVIKTLSAWPIMAESNAETKETINVFGPGKYEIKTATIEGRLVEKESSDKFLKTVYIMELDEVKFGFLGHLAKEFDSRLEEFFKNLDILFIPAGGTPFIDSVAVAKLCRRLSPKIIIPAFFKISGLKRPAETPTAFYKELGQKEEKPEEKFSFKKKELAGMKMKIVKLKA